ncbi:MAG: hypothetical protein CR996_01895 [Draconibacterium sp.]|nr:MAG: hypothetical protein CR996_01895 [Draconibacterium sp.]PIF06026.1 MAG: hypothetical protein CSA36_03815 [Draconibacterium sp.]
MKFKILHQVKAFYKLFITALVLVMTVTGCLFSNTDTDIAKPSLAEEKAQLQAYLNNLTDKGYNLDTTDLGVYYVVVEEGEGDFAKPGDTLTVGYAGFFIDGEMFESSNQYSQEEGTIKFTLGDPPIFPGWDDSMKLMNTNMKIQLIIPSWLAYGSEGAGLIPPYATLVYVVKLYNIKPKTEN